MNEDFPSPTGAVHRRLLAALLVHFWNGTLFGTQHTYPLNPSRSPDNLRRSPYLGSTWAGPNHAAIAVDPSGAVLDAALATREESAEQRLQRLLEARTRVSAALGNIPATVQWIHTGGGDPTAHGLAEAWMTFAKNQTTRTGPPFCEMADGTPVHCATQTAFFCTDAAYRVFVEQALDRTPPPLDVDERQHSDARAFLGYATTWGRRGCAHGL